MSSIKKKVASLAVYSGVFLLLINAAGFLVSPEIESNPGERAPVANYDNRTLAWPDAKRQFLELRSDPISPEDKARGLFKLVFESFLHTESYNNIKLWENWILWLGGTLLDRRYLKSQDPDFIWKRGGGHCSQAVTIFVAKGQQLGLKTRIVGLSGHVVAEVFLPDKGWRVVDPDMGIFWDHDLGSFGVNPNEEHVRNKFLALGYSEKISRNFSRVYVSQENNFLREFPTSPDRFLLEKYSHWAKWVIPFGLVGFGLVIRGRSIARNRFDLSLNCK